MTVQAQRLDSTSSKQGLQLPWWRQLRWNLAFAFLVLVVVPLALVIVLAIDRARASAEDQTINQLESVAELKTQEIELWLENTSAALNVLLAGDPRTNQFNAVAEAENPYGSTAQTSLAFVMRDAVADYAAIDAFFFYDAVGGRILVASDEDRVGRVVRAKPYFEPSLLEPYVQAPYYEVTNELTMVTTRPVVGPMGDVVGVLAAELDLDTLSNIMQERVGLGDTGETYLVSVESNFLLTASRFGDVERTRAYQSAGINTALSGDSGSGTYENYRGVDVFGVYRWLPSLQAGLLAEINQDEALADYNDIQRALVLLTAALALAAAGIGVWVATRFTRPMHDLAVTANRFASGELSLRSDVDQRNEIGQLGRVFNGMADQLQGMVASLEDRVEARTRDLFLTLEVGQMASRIYHLDELLPRITEYIREQFDLYYTQVYLTDDIGRYAVLRSGTGDVGRQLLESGHRLDLSATSIVARTVQSESPVLVTDTMKSDLFLPNPLLPETRSEVAIPLMVGNEVIGVLDMQARDAGTFREDNLPVFEAMASQLASAIRSAEAHTETEAAVERATQVNRRLTANAWQGYLGRVGTGQRVGYHYDLQTVEPLPAVAGPVDDVAHSGNGHNPQMKRPVKVGEQVIGQIALAEDGGREWSEEDLTLVDDVANRVAQALEQFRAFDETQASQRMLRTVIDTSPDWIFAKDTDYRYLLVNESFATFYGGLKPAEMQGLTDYELGTPVELIEGDPEQGIVGFRVDDRKVVERGETVFNPNDIVQFADGSRHVYETTKLPLRNAAGEIIGVLGIGRDVTASREAEGERRQVYEASRRINEATNASDLVSAVAESMRLPDANRALLVDFIRDESGEPVALDVIANWHSGEGYPPTEVGRQYDLNRFPTFKLLLQPEPVFFSDTMNDDRVDDRLREVMHEQEVFSLAALPLWAGGREVGALLIEADTARDYTEDEIRPLQTLVRQVAVALDSLQLLEQTQRRAIEMQSVSELGAEVATTLEPDQLLQTVCDLSKERFGLYHVHVYMLDEASNALALAAGAGEPGRVMVERGHRIPLAHSNSLVVRAARTLEPVVVNDVTVAPDYLPNPLLPQTRSEMAVPLMVGQKLLGVLDVQSDILNRFTDQDRVIQYTLASQIAVAVNNASLFAETQRRAVDMETVAQVGAEASTTLEPNELLQNVSDLTRERFDLYHAHIYLRDGENLVLAAGSGDAGRMMASLRHRIPLNREGSLVARSAREREPMVVNDVRQSSDFLPNPLLPHTRSEIAIPMIVGQELVGVMDVQDSTPGRFTEDEIRVMSTLASQIAVAVNNARLFAEQVEVTEQLLEVDRLKSEFLASMSHELRTPLNSIIGYAEVLLDGIDGELTDDMEEDVTAIHGSGKHLLNLINDILDLAKIEAGQMDLVTEALEMRELVEDMTSTTRVLIKNKPVELVVDIPDDLPEVIADPLRMRQVISNLLTNASKFTEEGSITVWARRYEEDASMVHIGVTDTGIGMDKEQVRVIFDRFRQVDQSHTRRAGGTGLGLSITLQLIQLHGGDIWVESEPGMGSTFNFTLPIAVDDEPVDDASA